MARRRRRSRNDVRCASRGGDFLTQRSGVDGSTVLASSEERVNGVEEGLGSFHGK
jgi:hypothetical protein